MKIKLRTFSYFGVLFGLIALSCQTQPIATSTQVHSFTAPALVTSNNKLQDSPVESPLSIFLHQSSIAIKKGEALKLTLQLIFKGKKPTRLEVGRPPNGILLSFQTMDGVQVNTSEAIVGYGINLDTGQKFSDEVLLLPGDRYLIDFTILSNWMDLPFGKYLIQTKLIRSPQPGLWSGTVDSNKVQLTYNP